MRHQKRPTPEYRIPNPGPSRHHEHRLLTTESVVAAAGRGRGHEPVAARGLERILIDAGRKRKTDDPVASLAPHRLRLPVVEAAGDRDVARWCVLCGNANQHAAWLRARCGDN